MPAPNRDPEHLDRLRDYYAEHRHIPSYDRIAGLIGSDSKGTTSLLMKRLEQAGFVERSQDDNAWIPTARFFERPLAEVAVRAGAPDMIDGSVGQSFLVDAYLIRQPSSTVMVPVKGDSMIEAGIHDGDIVVVEKNRVARKGDFVVAIVDGAFTLKELTVERGQFVLRPHNSAYPTIRPEGQLEIFGVVTGLIRRLLD